VEDLLAFATLVFLNLPYAIAFVAVLTVLERHYRPKPPAPRD
jgi:hypothetical protein